MHCVDYDRQNNFNYEARRHESTNCPAPSLMDTYDKRLRTFTGWPPQAPLRPDVLARAGLYYQGEGDRVYCAYCQGALYNWEEDDDAFTEHCKHFPNCPFVLHRLQGTPLPVPGHSRSRLRTEPVVGFREYLEDRLTAHAPITPVTNELTTPNPRSLEFQFPLVNTRHNNPRSTEHHTPSFTYHSTNSQIPTVAVPPLFTNTNISNQPLTGFPSNQAFNMPQRFDPPSYNSVTSMEQAPGSTQNAPHDRWQDSIAVRAVKAMGYSESQLQPFYNQLLEKGTEVTASKHNLT